MKLRTVKLIWWAVLLFGAVAWCRAQGKDWPDDRILIGRTADGDSVHFYPVEAYLQWWDEYKAECYADSHIVKSAGGPRGYGKPDVYTDSSGVEIEDYTGAYSVPAIYCQYSDVVHKEPTFSGFMSFIRRKAGE